MPLGARQVLGRLREGEEPSPKELAWFAAGLADGSISDAQAGAFAMGICRAPMGAEARAALTLAMRDTGDVLRWDLPGPVLDKHSTGGVGDCVSLLLAPALAACGAYVPMISGRGLGHTGGTLDKLEAIPGLSTALSEERFRAVVGEAGAAIVSASSEIATADKRLYRVRDVTGTVESLDLITASILAKKLAAGLEALVLDVKTGSGAFMKGPEEARALAQSLVSTAKAAGCPTSALITDMSQPLAPALGNALEVAECIAVLRGEGAGPLLDVTLALGAELLVAGELAANTAAGTAQLRAALESGAAADRFARMIAAMGGPADLIERPEAHLARAPVIRDVPAPATGIIARMDAEALGLAVVALGGGRQVESDVIDPAVGLSAVLPLGTTVAKGQPLARVHAASEDAAAAAASAVSGAITLAGGAQDLPPLIVERIS